LEVNPRNLCVTGTFTQSASAQVAPSLGAYGDGLKRRDRQSSCFDPSSALALPRVRPSDPPGLRRLRFPFFYPLVKEQCARSATPTMSPAFAAPIAKRERDLVPGYPRHVASCQTGDCCPLVARQHMAARARVNSIDMGLLSTPLHKHFRALACVGPTVSQMPQIGQHCAARLEHSSSGSQARA
jgi:hypothetical protein